MINLFRLHHCLHLEKITSNGVGSCINYNLILIFVSSGSESYLYLNIILIIVILVYKSARCLPIHVRGPPRNPVKANPGKSLH